MKKIIITLTAVTTAITMAGMLMFQKTFETTSITIETPDNAEDITLMYVPDSIEIVQVNDVVQGTTPSVTWNIEYSATRDAVSRTTVFGTNRTTTSTSGAETTTFTSSSIPPDQWVYITTSAQSGTVSELGITLKYEVIRQ